MSRDVTPRHQGAHYGIDAPYVPALLTVAGLVLVVLAVVGSSGWIAAIGVILLVQAALFLHTTLRGKFVAWSAILDGLGLRGDESSLDLGCGRGAVLVATARRLPQGRAHGVDLWRPIDQSGNALEATEANAAAEGVADRVELSTGDVTALPFDDDSFDLVTSSLAIHNITDGAQRLRAIDEAMRVLRPGGHLAIADIRYVPVYAERLRGLGAVDMVVRGLGPNFWYSGPWQATTLVTATKP